MRDQSKTHFNFINYIVIQANNCCIFILENSIISRYFSQSKLSINCNDLDFRDINLCNS